MRVFVSYYLLKLRYYKFDVLKKVYDELKDSLNIVQPNSVFVYSVFPLRVPDLLIWVSFNYDQEEILPHVLSKIAKVFYSNDVDLYDSLWGFTKPSIYTKTQKSPQEIDPFTNERKKYLIVYPFVKNTEWYLLKQDTRQGMMNEHIRIGRQYPQILQLLIYSFGLSDNEFVVSYETDSLVEFEKLVYDLRSSEARKYTLRDTPIYTAIYRQLKDFNDIF